MTAASDSWSDRVRNSDGIFGAITKFKRYYMTVNNDAGGGAGGHVLYQGEADDMYIKAYSVATLVIQNITEADDGPGAPLDKHNINGNSIKGKIYHFTESS